MKKLSEILNVARLVVIEPVCVLSSSLIVLTVERILSSHLKIMNSYGIEFVGCRPNVDDDFPKGCLWVSFRINDCEDLEIDC